MSIRTPSTKFFFRFRCNLGRPRPDMRTSVTSTRSKVKELLKFHKLQFSKSISTILAWSSKLMIGHDRMGPGLQLVGKKALTLSSNFAECRHYVNFKWPYFRIPWSYSNTTCALIVLHVLWMPTGHWRDSRSRSRSRGYWSSENCRKLHFSRPISSTILACS